VATTTEFAQADRTADLAQHSHHTKGDLQASDLVRLQEDKSYELYDTKERELLVNFRNICLFGGIIYLYLYPFLISNVIFDMMYHLLSALLFYSLVYSVK
jgi:hypothetical protein